MSMPLSKQTLEVLTDLVENKLSCFEVWDREDQRELKTLQRCLAELKGNGTAGAGTADRPRRGRPARTAFH